MEVDMPLTIACVVGIAALCFLWMWLENMNTHTAPGQARRKIDERMPGAQSINARTDDSLRELREKGASEPSGGIRKQATQSRSARDSEE